ncbi:hypothetical protein AC520_2492 [Enterobacter sp. OLF]|nr:hypothetical protein AC520_2492 [Enterobacter sp. OLF]
MIATAPSDVVWCMFAVKQYQPEAQTTQHSYTSFLKVIT